MSRNLFWEKYAQKISKRGQRLNNADEFAKKKITPHISRDTNGIGRGA